MARSPDSHLTAQPSNYRSLKDVSTTCRVSVRAARRWIERGLVPVKVTPGGQPRIGCDEDGWPIDLSTSAGDEQ